MARILCFTDRCASIARRVPGEWGEPASPDGSGGTFESRLGLEDVTVEVGEIEGRWGEYDNGTIRLNWRLIRAPVRIQDYVLVHELAHSVHDEHSDAFWNTVGALIPDYEDRREWLRLNVHLYWMPPTEYNRTDVDGALRAFGYKVKGAESAIDDRVVEQTRAGDWSVEMPENLYDSNIAFYSHVSSAGEIERTVETLVRHFSEFGKAYAADPDGHS